MKVSSLLQEYFDRENQSHRRTLDLPPRIEESFSLPVIPTKSGWERLKDPERIRRVFTFIDRSSLSQFVSLLLDYEDSIQHHGMHIIDHDQVSVEIYTKDLNRVTRIDLDYARQVDELFKQASFRLPEPGGRTDFSI
jgi:pterin-4a-carbinolamine dehydratase